MGTTNERQRVIRKQTHPSRAFVPALEARFSSVLPDAVRDDRRWGPLSNAGGPVTLASTVEEDENMQRTFAAEVASVIREFPKVDPVSEIHAATEDRSARVQALKEAIANGTYAPGPEEIARKLLDWGI